MTADEFLLEAKEITNIVLKTLAERACYSTKTDAFSAFKMCKRIEMTPQQSILARIINKRERLFNLLADGATLPEIEEEIIDLIGYDILLLGYLRSRKSVTSTEVDSYRTSDISRMDPGKPHGEDIKERLLYG